MAPPASTATRLSLCRLRLAITTLTARCSHPGSSYTGPGAQAHSGPARREPSRGAWMSMGCQLSQGTMECGQGGEHRQGEHCHGRVASQTQGRRHPGTSSARGSPPTSPTPTAGQGTGCFTKARLQSSASRTCCPAPLWKRQDTRPGVCWGQSLLCTCPRCLRGSWSHSTASVGGEGQPVAGWDQPDGRAGQAAAFAPARSSVAYEMLRTKVQRCR